MPLELSEGSFQEMRDFLHVVFAAYSEPYHPFVAMIYPGIGSDSKEIYEQGQIDAAERLVKGWKASSTEQWVKVVDTETREIVSISRWQIYKQNPFPGGPPHIEASWLPESSRIREYCTYLLNDRLRRQAERCPLPHIWLNMMCTHPKHRRRGAASLMLQWGVDKANEMDCEMFVEASWHGGQVYQKFGFIHVDEYWTRREDPEPDEEWKKLEETYPFTAAWMWRSKQGRHAGEKN